MHEEYALVRRDAPSPSSPTKSLHSQTEFDDATVEEMRLELYNLLVKPIEVFLRSIVPERVIIVPSGELAHVPWAMFLDVPFSIVPSLSIWHRLHLQSPPDTARAPNVSVFSNKPYDEEGASRDIPYARIEALYLSWLHAKRPALADDINRETFEKRFSGTLEILHLCAHSDFDYRDPLKSSVQLFKEPWSMDEWRKMAIRAHIVVFSSCLSAISKAYDSGSTLSFAHTLLATGTRAFVGSLWPVEDEATLLLMMLFYDGLRRPLAPDAALYQVSGSSSQCIFPLYLHDIRLNSASGTSISINFGSKLRC
jgi:CHAT domain-containing protein